MDNYELNRLAKLQQDAERSPTHVLPERLTIHDLVLLLREDPGIRSIIRGIVNAPAPTQESEQTGNAALDAEPASPDKQAAIPGWPYPQPADDGRAQLTPELALLQSVRADAELAAAWLGEQSEDESQQLLRVIVCASQWDLLAELWEKFAGRCKQQQRAAHDDELRILGTAVALHNLRWKGRQARLANVDAGTPYDFERHQRGTHSGDVVRMLWLPGLVNAGGQLHKKPIVQT